MRLKKQFLCIIAMLLMVASTGLAVNADVVQSLNSSVESSVVPRRDETEWVFRINPKTDVLEKRLWSITYGVWRTEWEPAT